MESTSPTRPAPSVPASWPAWLRTAVVWLLVAVIFTGFHFFYYPRYREQLLAEPEQFVRRAEHLLQSGEEAAALHVLQQGIATFNPPVASVYRACAALLGADDDAEKSLMEGRAAFYDLVAAPSSEGLRALQDAAGGVSVADDALLTVWQHFSRALHLPELSGWSAEAAASIFSLAGSVFSADGKIGSTGVTSPVALLAYSGGGADHRRGLHLFIGDRDYGSNKRGMHVALLDATTGEVLAVEVFDLWERPEEGRRLEVFLQEAPESCLGLFAVCDDGAGVLTHELEDSLLRFGLDRLLVEDRRARVLGIRASFAAIGVKGASPGSALQVWSPQWFGDHRGHPVLCAVLPEESP